MAKRGRGGVNVSQMVRDYKSQHKRSKPKDIAAALNDRGVKISSQYVSTVLSNWRRKKGRRVRAAAGAAQSNGRGSGISIAQLVKAKKLVRKLGGVDEAKKMIDALSKILD
jgi:hypothetical protein